MKKCILTAVIFLAMSGFAAAQSTTGQDASKSQKTATQKGTTQKTNSKKASSTTIPTASQPDPSGKIRITMPAVDTTGIPVKKKQ